ncbi:membrane protein [Stutzerimonas stutzeri]|uniref:outer membrane protein OmpK n=1 Tax=Stutzerimonas stutzeri subgroup TaxID=578833 RepID=UPI000627686E|nr:outer membrane protein OmpK [Stutzerimonas kunmingensis]KKJ94899.1 membrane protein [Stutzerimonas stutzeri]HAG77307.1 hypothetical protein [Pseudomonas sp.]
MQLKTAPLAVALAGSLLTAPAMAEGLLHWQSNSLTYLYGKDYKIDAPIQQTVTFEHVNGWKYGDTFLFLDSIHFNGKGNDNGNDDSTFYGEFSPRLSFGKIFQRDLSFGPIKDVLVAMTYEFGEGDVETYMIGPGFDLDVPGFDYVSVNVYHRDTDGDRVGDGTWQVTPVWGYTLPVGNSDILIDGFIDWVVDNDSNSRGEEYHANLHINPQIKYDLGKAMNWGEKQLYVGIEYDYWSDKYGIENGGFVSENFVGKTDQNTFSAIVKAHF